MLTEEKANARKALLFIFFSLTIVIFLFWFGIPLITRITPLLTGLRRQSVVSENPNTAPPGPPVFDVPPEATNKANLTVTGSVAPGNTVVVNFNGGESEIAAESNGKFTTNFDLVKGVNSLFGYAKDPTGNLSEKSRIYSINYDTDPPKIEITSPPDGANFYGSKQQTVSIKGKVEAGVTLTVNDRLVSVADDGNFTYDYPLAEGENNLNFKAVDKAGNETDSSLKLNYSS